MQRVKLTLCKLAIGRFFISERPEILRTREVGKPERTEVTGGKNAKSGGRGRRRRLHFFGFRLPNSVLGSSRPPARHVVPLFFSR